jgi:hypothetical protein
MASQIPYWFNWVKLLEGNSHCQITTEVITVVSLAPPGQLFGFFFALVTGATTGFFEAWALSLS